MMKMNKVFFAALAFTIATSFSFDCQASKYNDNDGMYGNYRTDDNDGLSGNRTYYPFKSSRYRTSGSKSGKRGYGKGYRTSDTATSDSATPLSLPVNSRI